MKSWDLDTTCIWDFDDRWCCDDVGIGVFETHQETCQLVRQRMTFGFLFYPHLHLGRLSFLHRGYCQLSIALPFPSAAGTGSGHKIHAPMSSKAQLKEWQMSRWVFSGGLESYPSHKTHRGPRRLRVMRMGLLPLASS